MLAVSPHLDDAVFSAGALLWSAAQSGCRVVVATVFTGNVESPAGFALACQLDKGLAAEVDYMALRRDEDRRACAELGAEVIHLSFLEAPHRGYHSAPALFGGIHPDDAAGEEIAPALAALIAELKPDQVLAPLTIGGHVDHLIVRAALEAVADHGRVRLWEDWPYLERAGSIDRAFAQSHPVLPPAREAKHRACLCYASQLGFQFGGAEKLERLLSGQSEEWYHQPMREAVRLDARRGFEPRLTESESVVLPLDDRAARRALN